MTKTMTCTSALLATLLLSIGVSAQAATSKDAYTSQKQAISQTYDAAKKQCDTLAGNTKDVCVKQAKADRDIADADNEADYKNTPKARAEAARTKAKAQYSVDDEKCDDLAGNNKDVCVTEAKARRDKALADIDANKTVVKAKTDATSEKNEADYKVAKAKCDVLAGDAKTTCVDEAKSSYGM